MNRTTLILVVAFLLSVSIYICLSFPVNDCRPEVSPVNISFLIIWGKFDALHQLSVKKDPLEIQHPKLENSRRGFIESVHER